MAGFFDRVAPPVLPGQRPLATDTNATTRTVNESAMQTGTGYTGIARNMGGTQIRDFGQTDLFGRITGSGGSGSGVSGTVYSWVQVIRSFNGATWETLPNGLFGTITSTQAREINNNTGVPVGAVVRLTPSQGTTGLEFQWGEGIISGSSSGGGTGDRLKGFVVGDTRCESGILNVYMRADYWDGQGGYYGPLFLSHTAGCCECGSSGSGTSGSSGGTITTTCCPSNPLPTTITGTFSSKTGYATNFPTSATFTYVGGVWKWTPGTLPACSALAELTLSCAGSWSLSSGASLLGPGPTSPASGVCSPFVQVFNVPNAAYGCGTMSYTLTFTA
jgi:hypothetical protein